MSAVDLFVIGGFQWDGVVGRVNADDACPAACAPRVDLARVPSKRKGTELSMVKQHSAFAQHGAVRASRYSEVAAQMTRLIERGAYRPGQRVPSVRALSRQLRVSVTTVLAGYRCLEAAGVLEARPRAGYFVPNAGPRAPASCRVEGPALVQNVSLVLRLLHEMRRDDVVPFNGALPGPEGLLLEPLTRALRATTRRSAIVAKYEPPPGSRALREQIARHSLAAGLALAPDEITITSGAQEALYLALATVTRPFDVVAVEAPTYYGVLQAAEALALRVIEIPTHPTRGLSLASLRDALERYPLRAVVAAPSYTNPSGGCMREEERRELVDMLARAEVALIEDDLYGDLTHEGERPRAAKAFDRQGRVLLCSSFSKVISPDVRVGWVVAGRYQAALERRKVAMNTSSCAFVQHAVSVLLADGTHARHLRRVRALFAERARAMAEAVMRLFPAGTRVSAPRGGFLLWVELPAEGPSASALYERALSRGIALAPGPIFSSNARFEHHFRLNSAIFQPERLPALATLGELARGAT
jgi:DNA-binding transcriptional MocR family regulator